MSLILRSLNQLRSIASVNRCLISTSLRLPQTYNPAVVFTGSTKRYCSASVASQENRTDSLQQKLDDIDRLLQKVGRITRNDVNDVINMLKTVRQTTSVQSLLMIRCCGNLVVDEYPENRMKMVNELWNTLEELKIPLDISHFNALLRVYIENDYDFDPLSILIDLEKRAIEPNRITYQRLIACFCNKGDISGASKILQFMKDKQMAINEPIFNSLMVCHFENKDSDSAVAVLDMMKTANFEPTNDTYSALLCGYAKLGQIDEIHKLLSDLKNKDVTLSDKHYLEIVYNLAVNGHHEHVPQILGEIRGTFGYNQEAINMIFRLLIKNQVSVAYEVSKTMYHSEFDEHKSGVALINQMVNLNRSSDEILDVCKRLCDDGLNDRAIYLACGKTLNTANLELALPLFEALQQSGGEIRQHFFWPFLVKAGRAGNVDEVFRILDIIINRFNIQPNLETLTDYVISNLNIESKELIRRLQHCGIQLNSIILSLVISKLSLNNIKEAAYISTLFPATFSLNAIRKHLVHSLYATSDVKSFMVIAKQVIDSQIVNNDDDIDVAGNLLFDIIFQAKKGHDHLIGEVISAFKENKIYIQNRTVDRIAKTNHVNIEDILRKVAVITDNSANGKFKGRRFSSNMHIEFMEDRLEKAVQNEKDPKGLMSVLLLNYCQKREYEKLDDLLAEIEKEHDPDFEFKAIHLANLIEVFSIRNDVVKVDFYLQKLRQDHSDFVLDDSKIIRMVRLFIQNDMCDRAFDILQNVSAKLQDSQSNWLKTDLWRSLFYLAEKGDEVHVHKLFDILQNRKLIVMSNSFLGPLVKVHLVKGDLEKAFSTFEMLSVKYNSTPLKNELTKAIIASDDKDKLNQLIEIGLKTHGATNMYSDLMFSYLEMGRVQEAKRVLEKHLSFCPHEKIVTKCSKYLEYGEEKLLEDLLKVTKDVYQFHRIEIYNYLLQAYIKNDNVDKAYNLWLDLQEDDVNPNDEFLANLGTFLKSHNQIVPFQIPEVSELQRTRNAATSSDININTEAIKRIRLAIFNNDLRKVEELMDQCYKDLTYFDKSNLIEVYSKNNYLKQAKEVIDEMIANDQIPLHRVLNYYVNRLSANGMVAECEELCGKINYHTRRAIAVDNKLCAAYVNANRAAEYLDNMERELNDTSADFDSLTKKFPFGAIMNLCSMNPELIEKYEKIAQHFYKKGYHIPMNSLWQYYFIKEDFETAKTILDQYLKSNPRLMFGGITNEARRLNNERVFEELLQVSKTVTFSELDCARLCYSYIQTLTNVGKVDRIEQLLSNLHRDVNVNNLPKGLVNQLTAIAQKNGLSFPLDELVDRKVVQ